MAESAKIVLVSCIIDFDGIKVLLRLLSLSLNACKFMEAFLIFSCQNLKKTIITLQALRLELSYLNIQAELEEAKSTKQLLRRALFQGARKETFHGFVLAELEQIMSKEDCKAFGDMASQEAAGFARQQKTRS